MSPALLYASSSSQREGMQVCRRRQTRPACRPRWKSLGRAGVTGCCPATLPPMTRQNPCQRQRPSPNLQTVAPSMPPHVRHPSWRPQSHSWALRPLVERCSGQPHSLRVRCVAASAAELHLPIRTLDDARREIWSPKPTSSRQILAFVFSAICPFVDHSIKLRNASAAPPIFRAFFSSRSSTIMPGGRFRMKLRPLSPQV